MGTVRLPCLSNPSHSSLVRRVPGHPIPVRVHDQRAPAGLEHPEHLADRPIRVVDVFKRLYAYCCIEGCIWQGQLPRVALLISEPLAGVPFTSKGQEVVGNIHPKNPTAFANSLGHLFAQKPRAASYVHDRLAVSERQAIESGPSLCHYVSARIDGL